MAIVLKSAGDVARMRAAGRVAADVASAMANAARAGVTTAELDQLAAREMTRAGAVSAIFHGRGGGGAYPAHTCISVNEQVLNGVPAMRVLRDGDILSVDVSVLSGGWCGSRAMMLAIGEITPQKQRLIEVANETLSRAIAMVRPMRKWSAIAREIQQQIESAGFQVVREFVGHGIGRKLFEDPKVFNHVDATTVRGDFPLRAGMTLTIEPILVAGAREVVQLEDGWTVVTVDGQPGAHVRHTVAVTERGAEVLSGGGGEGGGGGGG
jgi:methionyl aminopeptidase